MKAYIHAINGKPWNEECAAAYRGFRSLGVQSVLFSSTDELFGKAPEDVVVGGSLIMEHALKGLCDIPLNYSYPPELEKFYGRDIHMIKLADVYREHMPVFIKPVQDKLAPGIVLTSASELSKNEFSNLPPETQILCSEVISILSEWRCFILYGKIIGLRFYHGDRSRDCDYMTVKAAVNAYKAMPAGFSIDFGVTDNGRTIVIEANDGFALGCYGLRDDLYARLLSARWAELTGTRDEFRSNPLKC